MKRAIWPLVAALCLSTGAVAQDDPPPGFPVRPQPEQPARPDGEGPAVPRVKGTQEESLHPFESRPPPRPLVPALVETELIPTTEGQVTTPPHWTGEREAWEERSFYGAREANRRFLQPLLHPSVFPTISARAYNAGGWNPRGAGSGELDQLLHLSLYALELYAPMLNFRGDEPFGVEHFRLNLRLPVRFGERHAFAFFVGGLVPVQGTWTDNGGANTMVGYAYGGESFSAQVRGGFGIDRLIGEFDASPEPNMLWDAAVGVPVGRYVQAVLQADGRARIGAASSAFRVWPMVRFFPLGEPTFSVGVGGQAWFDDLDDGYSLRRAGGALDVGYTFF
jgi:hypothetical protein